MAIDVVEPCATIESANHLSLQDDIAPLSDRNKRNCTKTKVTGAPEGTDHATIEWEVGGGVTIDDASSWYEEQKDLPEEINGASQPFPGALDKLHAEEEDST